LPGPGGFGRRSPGAHYHPPTLHQPSAYLAASLTYGSQVTDSHFAAHTDPVVAFTDDATAAHSHLHPNVSAFTYRHGSPGRYCHTDYRTDRYAYSHGHPASHRHAHGYGHGHLHAFTHPHGLAHRHTYRHSHGYGYGHAYRNQFANRYPNFHALSHEPAH